MMLSKSKYTRGLQCPKLLWLYIHKKKEQFIDSQQQKIFSQGTKIGEMARDFFKQGKLAVLEGEYPSKESEKRTKTFISKGEKNIFEATFLAEKTIVAIDILHKNKKGNWDIYEVKSTNNVKEQHKIDLAVQYFIAQASGIKIDQAFILHLNRDYVRRGDIEVKELFTPKDCTKEVQELQPEIKANISRFLKLIAQKEEPKIEIGDQCYFPYQCSFKEYCESFLPPKNEENKEIDRSATILKKEIRQFVKSNTYPVAHLDFETIMPPVPMWNEARPYEQIVFQYSIHIQNSPKDKKIHHYEYLAPCDEKIDPRIGLIQNVIKETKVVKTIFVYNETFEKSRIKEMIRDFPEYAKDLQKILDKIVDIARVFKGINKPYKFHQLKPKEWSIKKILPLICEDLSYEDLEISEGNTASETFYSLYFCQDKDYIQKTRKKLLEYCKMDTFAMVKIWEKISKI